jgi:regulator of protease activity HflC (stomatin/prohibitin superfamily)
MKIDLESPSGIAALVSRGVVLGLIFLLVILISSSFTVISPGNMGVVFNIWTGSLRTVPQGMAWRMPFITEVQSYPTALRTYTMVRRANEGSSPNDDSIDLPTLEGQHIRQDLSVTYSTSMDKAAEVFKAFRGARMEEIEDTFIRRTIITVAQNAAGQMSLSEVISSKRNLLQENITERLAKELEKMGFNLDKVNLGASHLPAALEAQMQQKMAAQQEAQQAEYELQKQEMLAKATVAKAQGEAQSILVRARADAEANKLLQSTLTPILVQNKAIEKWNGTLPQVTGGAMPFINIKGASAEK